MMHSVQSIGWMHCICWIVGRREAETDFVKGAGNRHLLHQLNLRNSLDVTDSGVSINSICWIYLRAISM